jgi:hypothetical protein
VRFLSLAIMHHPIKTGSCSLRGRAPELRIEHFNCMYKVFHGSKRWRSQTGFLVEEQRRDQEPLSKIA